jgi:hypothetical protein
MQAMIKYSFSDIILFAVFPGSVQHAAFGLIGKRARRVIAGGP